MASFSNATFKQICRFRRDSADWKDFSIMTDSHSVWLNEQAYGEASKQHIGIPRGIFNRLIHQYLKERKFVR